MPDRPGAVLITGATATGKSAFASNIARERNGVVINADSMQVYDVLRIVTARPAEDASSTVPHLLYGHVSPLQAYSVGEWISDAKEVLSWIADREKIPVFVGGTGLYFRALTEGLSPIPRPEPGIRAKWREVAKTDPDCLHEALRKRDPSGAGDVDRADTQRLVRALEVFDSTGRPISYWTEHTRKEALLGGWNLDRILLQLPRSRLHERINARFDLMIRNGALDEVARLAAMNLDTSLPAMKAIGVPQLLAHLRGELTLEQSIERAKAASRQYAKRQMTWFRTQFGPQWQVFALSDT